jgi:hypothetical protein
LRIVGTLLVLIHTAKMVAAAGETVPPAWRNYG